LEKRKIDGARSQQKKKRGKKLLLIYGRAKKRKSHPFQSKRKEIMGHPVERRGRTCRPTDPGEKEKGKKGKGKRNNNTSIGKR